MFSGAAADSVASNNFVSQCLFYEWLIFRMCVQFQILGNLKTKAKVQKPDLEK